MVVGGRKDKKKNKPQSIYEKPYRNQWFYKAVPVYVYVWELQKNDDYLTRIYVANFSSVSTKKGKH